MIITSSRSASAVFGDEVDRITEIDILTGEIRRLLEHIAVFPASHYVVPKEQMTRAADAIEAELKEQVEAKAVIYQRIFARTVPRVHAANLRHRNMRFINQQQKFLREIGNGRILMWR